MMIVTEFTVHLCPASGDARRRMIDLVYVRKLVIESLKLWQLSRLGFFVPTKWMKKMKSKEGVMKQGSGSECHIQFSKAEKCLI